MSFQELTTGNQELTLPSDHATDDPATGDGGTIEPDRSALEGSDQGEAVEDATETETYVDLDLQSRLWIKAITPLLAPPSADTPLGNRAQFAFDQMYVAACERLARILRSDLEEVSSS